MRVYTTAFCISFIPYAMSDIALHACIMHACTQNHRHGGQINPQSLTFELPQLVILVLCLL